VKNHLGSILGTVLLELLFMLIVLLVGFIAYSYIVASKTVFSALAVIQYGSGWESFWLVIFFWSDLVFFIIVMLCFLELVLWLGRTAVKTVLRAQEKITGVSQEKAKNFFRKISFVTLFRLLGVRKITSGVILYFAVMVGVLGSGWVAKTVLKGTDSLVYRAHELINLESDVTLYDMSAEIESETPIHLFVTANVGVVHRYTVTDETEAKVYFLYDTAEQKADYSLNYENHTFTIVFNDSVCTYEPYVDPVLPSLEIYLPRGVVIGNVEVTLCNFGYLTTEYFGFSTMNVVASHAQIAIKATAVSTGSLEIDAIDSKLNLTLQAASSATIKLQSSTATMSLGAVSGTFDLECQGADVLLHSTTASNFTADVKQSKIELRELYATTVLITMEESDLLYYNSNSEYVFSSLELFSTGEENILSIKGVPFELE